MKVITYEFTVQTPRGSYLTSVTVTARDINAGARKALARATKDLPDGHEFVRLEFWTVV